MNYKTSKKFIPIFLEYKTSLTFSEQFKLEDAHFDLEDIDFDFKSVSLA